MKSKLLLKEIDFYLQIAAAGIPILLNFLPHWNGAAFIAWFSVGLVQIISCIVNSVDRDEFSQHRSRKAYEITLLILVLSGIVSMIFMNLMYFYLVGMLVMGVVMAIWYGYMTYREMQMIRIRVDRQQYV
jgi:hypothetical protein